MPMQYTGILKVPKNENFQQSIFYIFLIFAQSIDLDGSNENSQSMFWSKNKKTIDPIFSIQKVGLRGYILHGHVFLLI